MKTKLVLQMLLILFLINSCDILRLSLFEVVSWSPGDGYHSNPENIVIFLGFSREPDKGSVEKNFSLTGNGNRIRGTFLWDGNKMTFVPLTPLEINTDYTISLLSDAHDVKGLSMDDSFTRNFTTRPGNDRPVIISFYPAMYEEIDDLRMEINLRFSFPVDINSLYNSVSFSPSMTGSWRLEDSGKLAVFTPVEPWQQKTRYEIKVSASLTGINGMNINKEYLSVFNIGSDKEIPVLLSARRITKYGDIIELSAETENGDWEKEDKLSLVFSKPVDWITVKNNLSAAGDAAQDAPSFIFESEYNNEFIFRFNSVPSFESRFTVRIKPGIKDFSGNQTEFEYSYRIFANGKSSKPPELIGLRIPVSPGSENLRLVYFGIDSNFESIEISDAYYPSGNNVPTWIELYFNTAEDTNGEKADIDQFSLMALFNVTSSSNAISFSPQEIKKDNFSVTEPHTGREEYKRIEIAGFLTNSTRFGIINFQIGSGLRDSLDNINEKQQMISVVK